MSSSIQIILITGANQGLGYLTALQLSKIPGYHVFVGARSTEKGAEAVKKIEADGAASKVEAILLDVDSDESINAAIKHVESKAGRLDVLVNNAAIALDLPGKGTTSSVRKLMETTYTTNVFGVASLIEAALPLLEKSDFPRIVNVSSGLGSITFHADKDSFYYNFKFIAYNTSKSALNALTVHYAYVLEKKKPGSRVFALDPGYNATNLNGYSGQQDPKIGAAGIVAAVTQGQDSEWKTADYRDQFGKLLPW